MLVLSKAGYMSEIEIKISVSDFKADFTGKPDKHEMLIKGKAPMKIEGREWVRNWELVKPHCIKHFYFAVPVDLHAKIDPLLPDYAGLIVVDRWAKVVKKAPVLTMSRKATDKERCCLLRAMYHRGWTRFRENIKNGTQLLLTEDKE